MYLFIYLCNKFYELISKYILFLLVELTWTNFALL